MLTHFLIVLVFFLILDAIWFKFSLPSYQVIVQRIQGSPLELNFLAAAMAYLLLALGVTYLVLPRMVRVNLMDALTYGGLFGLVTYGIFDFTNMALFKNWNLSISLIDMLWGIFNCTMVTYLSMYLIKLFRL